MNTEREEISLLMDETALSHVSLLMNVPYQVIYYKY